ALRLCCLRAYVGEPMPPPGGPRTSSSGGQRGGRPIEPTGALRCSHPGRVLLQGDDARGASLSRPMAACGLDVPGKRTPRGVAHLRYACVVCALTSASGCAPGRDEHQLVRGAAGGPAHRASRCATLFAPGRVLLQDYDIREAGSRQPPCSVLLVPAQILRDRRFGHRAGTLSLALLILADL